MATMVTTEKRSSTRVSYLCEVECYGVGASPLNPRIADISVTGAFIDSMTALPVGSRLTLKFRLGSEMTRLAAEVVHSMPQIGMGVRFVDLTSPELAALERLVEGPV